MLWRQALLRSQAPSGFPRHLFPPHPALQPALGPQAVIVPPLRALQVDGEPAEPPHPLAWYPGKLAWQMNFSRSQLRKQPVLAALHEFMKRENEVGERADLRFDARFWIGRTCAAHASCTQLPAAALALACPRPPARHLTLLPHPSLVADWLYHAPGGGVHGAAALHGCRGGWEVACWNARDRCWSSALAGLQDAVRATC